jgi:hypothetical protein
MLFDLAATRAAVSVLEAKLRPIASRRVDINSPNWWTRPPSPLDEAGVRGEAEILMASILGAYGDGDASLRASIRQLLADAQSFAWWTGVSLPPTTVDGFKKRLLRISAMDRQIDPRDVLSQVHELCAKAQSAGVETVTILREVAALSSDEPNGWTRSILLRAC